jgi:Bacterial Ig-like domain (group 3)/Beta-propeller repeat
MSHRNLGKVGGFAAGRVGLAVVACLLGPLSFDAAASAPVARTQGAAQPRPGAEAKVTALPLSFEPNVGQAGTGTQYLAHGPGYALTLDGGGAALALGADVVRLRLAGAREDIEPTAESPLPGRINYYIGNDRSKWRENVATFGKVRYSQVYRGIDLVYHGTQGRLEYDFDVAPGASAGSIRVAFDGAERISLDARGNLHVAARGRDVIFDRPIAYQLQGREHRSVSARYRVHGQTVSFELGAHDPRKALVIDPVLDYFSYLGGSSADVIGVTSPQASGTSGQAAALDGSNELYVAGYTVSTNFPTVNPFASTPTKTYGTHWAFVTKFAADASSLIFSTYLGGTNGDDFGYGIAVDSQGNAFVTGSTGSNDFPATAGAYQTICSPNYNNAQHTAQASCADNGQQSAFVTKLSPSGALLASRFLGSTYAAYGAAVAVDAAGRPYVAGYAYPGENIPSGLGVEAQAVGFPTTTGAVVSAYNYSSTEAINGALQYDAFVSVFNPTLATLMYSTLMGDDRPFSAIAANGSQTNSIGTAVTVDVSGNFYLVGYTQDTYLPTTAGVYEPNPVTCGNEDTNTTQFNGNCGFVSKFSPVGGASGTSLIYATYLGGQATAAATSGSSKNDFVTGVAADAAGDAYVVGFASEAGFPTTAGAYQSSCDGYNNATNSGDWDCSAAFIAKLNPTGSTLLASTYLGCLTCSGDAMATVGAIALDASNDVFIGGFGGNGLPLVNGSVSNNTIGGQAPYVAELDSTLATLKFSTFVNVGNAGQISPAGLALDSSGGIYVAGNVNSPTNSAATSGAFQSAYGGGSSDGFVAKITVTAATTTTLHASASSATVGVAVTFTANVAESSGSAIPTGTVTFKNGSTTLGTGTLTNLGAATFTTSTLAVGSYSVTAAYGGDANNSGSTSSATSLTVAAAPAPTVTIAVSPTSITLGKTSTLTWSSSNATSCTAGNAWSGTEAASGTSTLTPTAVGSLIYALSCTGAGGTTTQMAVLTVAAVPAPTVTIGVSPTSITVGQSATLTWSSTNATSCTASSAWTGTQATSGTVQETPTAAGSPSYTLTCTGTGGSGSGSATLTVAAAAAGHRGGGALDLWTLVAMALLALVSAGARASSFRARD